MVSNDFSFCFMQSKIFYILSNEKKGDKIPVLLCLLAQIICKMWWDGMVAYLIAFSEFDCILVLCAKYFQ